MTVISEQYSTEILGVDLKLTCVFLCFLPGLDPDDPDSGIDDSDEESDNTNIYESLQLRYQYEKEALIARLKGNIRVFRMSK